MKILKIFLMTSSLLLVFSLGHAQKFGFKLGGNFSTFCGEDAKDSLYTTGLQIGPVGGIYVKIGTKWIFLEPGINYSVKGFKQDLTNPFFTFEGTYTTSYLEIPVNVNVKLPIGLGFYAGGYAAILLGAKGDLKISVLGVDSTFTYDKGDLGFNTLDVGANAGIRWHLPFGLSFGIGYSRGFMSVFDDSYTADSNDPTAFDIFSSNRKKTYVNSSLHAFVAFTLP